MVRASAACVILSQVCVVVVDGVLGVLVAVVDGVLALETLTKREELGSLGRRRRAR